MDKKYAVRNCRMKFAPCLSYITNARPHRISAPHIFVRCCAVCTVTWIVVKTLLPPNHDHRLIKIGVAGKAYSLAGLEYRGSCALFGLCVMPGRSTGGC